MIHLHQAAIVLLEMLFSLFYLPIWRKRAQCPWLKSQVFRILKFLATHQCAGAQWLKITALNHLIKRIKVSFFNPHPRHFLLLFRKRQEEAERERLKERNIDMREKHWSVASLNLPQQGIEPTTWVCALIGNQTCHLSVYGSTLQPTEPHQPETKMSFYRMRPMIKIQLIYM